ncbi:MAG: anthranilate synthase component 1, partial [Gammaproteobacteria bacterium]
MTISHKLDGIPDLLAVHALKPDSYPYLLASNSRGGENSRYSILLSHPREIISQWLGDEDCLTSINVDIANPRSHSDLPFSGGWFVFLSYEYAHSVEPSVTYFPEQSSLPVAFKARVPAAIIVDHEQDKAYIIVEDQAQQLIEQ